MRAFYRHRSTGVEACADVSVGIIYLTPHTPLVVGGGGPNHDSERAPGAPEIEVTPEMITAGETVIFDWSEELMAFSLAVEVYRAMEPAKKYQQTS